MQIKMCCALFLMVLAVTSATGCWAPTPWPNKIAAHSIDTLEMRVLDTDEVNKITSVLAALDLGLAWHADHALNQRVTMFRKALRLYENVEAKAASDWADLRPPNSNPLRTYPGAQSLTPQQIVRGVVFKAVALTYEAEYNAIQGEYRNVYRRLKPGDPQLLAIWRAFADTTAGLVTQ